MVPRKILVIDDEADQAKILARKLEEWIPESKAEHASTEDDINKSIVDSFYNLAVLDIRMDGYDFNGLSLASKILEVNPYTKIIFVSRFLSEYSNELMPLMQNGNVLGFSEKRVDYQAWGEELKGIILPYYEQLDENPQAVNDTLINIYAELKDQKNTYRRGIDFENFVVSLLMSMGFRDIMKRVRDKSMNEVDMIVRNEIDDNFFSKFNPYILVECKNKQEDIEKNDFILFKSKLDATNGLSNLGFMFSTSSFKRTAYLEAMRTSQGENKVIFLDNKYIMRLIKATDIAEELKRIIDEQVKDN